MALSRTARILIALLLVAAAGFFWVNFFQQAPNDSVIAAVENPVTTAVPLHGDGDQPVPNAAPNADGIVAGPGDEPRGGEASVAGTDHPNEISAAPADGVTPAPQDGAADGSPSDAVLAPPPVVLRDLQVSQLPFLITEPPVAGEGELAAEDDEDARAQSTQRANVNPFSPVLVKAPPAAPQQPTVTASAPSSSDAGDVQVVEVNGSPAGASTPTTVVSQPPPQAPAPRAVAPAARGTALPRPLPSGTLSATPDILRGTRTQPQTRSGPSDLSTVAAVRVPGDEAAVDLPLTNGANDIASDTALDPLGTGHQEAAEAAAQPTQALPLAVGADPLSRYLRDYNVRFTGSVLGPLSVGVFRSTQFTQPVVLTLGQSLPETDILLADLRGYEAKFSLNDRTQVLSLDLRR